MRNKRDNTILNVKKSNFLIYISCLLFGITFIVIYIIVENTSSNKIAGNIFLAVGASTLPTVITAYLIEQATEKRRADKIRELRDHFLWGMPHGLLWIMKVIVEEYYLFDSEDKPLIDCFESAVDFMENIRYKSDEYNKQTKDIELLLSTNKLGYGLSLCLRDCESILNHEYEMEIYGVFSKDELLSIRYLYEECDRIRNSFVICEMAEYIRLFVKNTIDNINEISVKAKRIAVVKNRIVLNWYEISK